MNKLELVNRMAEIAGLTKTDTKKVLDAFVQATTEDLVKGNKIQLVGFGTFSISERAARKGRNPQKPSEIINIPAKKVVKFVVGSELKNAVK